MSKSKAQELMRAVNSALGVEALKPASSKGFTVTRIPTGILPVDVLLNGGLPRGRFTLIVGDYSTLKSFIGLMAIVQCQKEGGVAALIDTERAFDPDWAASLGVDVDSLLVWPPRGTDSDNGVPVTGEMAVDTAEAMTRAGVDLLVFDSIAATLPQTEQNRRLHDESQQMARLAALMSKAMRKLTAANSKTAYLWINQYRINVGVTFGNPNTITGGKAQLYFASQIIEVKKVGKVTRDTKTFDGEKWKGIKEQVGQKYQMVLTKSKLSKPFRDIFFDWDLTTGDVNLPMFLMSQGMEHGFVKNSGTKYSYMDLQATGRAKFMKALEDDADSMYRLENDIRAHHGIDLLPPLPKKSRVTKSTKSTKTRRSLKR